ncbi:MAG: LssY C-terminal domain-containing protein [Deltaproteobacteria bacterium]
MSTTSSRLHGAVTARVVREATADGAVVVPLGTLVSGEISKLIPSSSPQQRARMMLKFDRLTLPGDSAGKSTAGTPPLQVEFSAHVADIENAREKVFADGTVQGVLASELPLAMIESGIAKLGKRRGASSSGSQSGDDMQKQSAQVLGKSDTSINYPAGTDLRLVLDQPLALSRTFVSAISNQLPQGTLNTIQNLLADAPKRVSGKDGKPGDPINLVVIGDQAEIQQTFEKAGWLEPETSGGSSVWQATRAILGDVGYGKAPVSDLYLFGRKEDLAFAKMLNTVAKRHHLRLWRAEGRTADGREIWLGAATHDAGYDVRPGVISHAIEADLDDERAKVAADLAVTGMVASEQLVTRADPLTEGLTATGASWKTDGRLIAIELKPK